MGELAGIVLNVFCQYLIYRYLIVYYMHDGKKDKFEQNKTGFSIVIIIVSLIVYSIVAITNFIVVIGFLIGLIYFAYTLHKKWNTNELLPNPMSSIDKEDGQANNYQLFNFTKFHFDELNYTDIEKFKIGVLIKRIKKLNRLLKVLSFKYLKYIPSLVIGFFGGLLTAAIVILLLYESYGYEQYGVIDPIGVIIGIYFGILICYYLSKYFDKIITKYSHKRNTQLTSYFDQLEKSHPDLVKEFGGIDTLKDLMFNIKPVK